MGKIDTIGAYRGKITEHGLSTTKRGFPQFTARLHATEKWVDDEAGMEHFGLEEPGWVDWSSYDESMAGYFVLFNDADTFDADSQLLNYEQVQLATGWDGTEFDSLNDDSYVGKEVLFRVEENDYNETISLQVAWIDSKDASPVRELRKLDADGVKDLAGKLKIKKKAKPATAAKPSAKPAAKPAAKEESKKEAKAPAPPKAKKKEELKEEPKAAASDLPTEVEQGEAWEFVCKNKGDNSDSDIEDAWIASCQEVGADTEEEDFTKEMWAQVRDLVIRDMSLDV